jgi:DTW domain-containing protein YfiP
LAGYYSHIRQQKLQESPSGVTNNLKPAPCPRCGLHYQCVCTLIPALDTHWHLALLMHPNEIRRDTNSGKLLELSLNQCQSYQWQRTEPPQALIERINSGRYRPVLLFPGEKSATFIPQQEQGQDNPCPPLFILLDATWQEAKKMVNRSPWLQELPAVQLDSTQTSSYSLRKNQQPGNLCSCEVGIELLKLFNKNRQAEKLNAFFNYYLKVFSADKSGHKYIE